MKTLGLLAAAMLPGAVAVGTDGAAEGTNFIGARRSAERRGGVSETSRTRAALSKPFLPLRRRETAARCCCWARSEPGLSVGRNAWGRGSLGLSRGLVSPRGVTELLCPHGFQHYSFPRTRSVPTFRQIFQVIFKISTPSKQQPGSRIGSRRREGGWPQCYPFPSVPQEGFKESRIFHPKIVGGKNKTAPDQPSVAAKRSRFINTPFVAVCFGCRLPGLQLRATRNGYRYPPGAEKSSRKPKQKCRPLLFRAHPSLWWVIDGIGVRL